MQKHLQFTMIGTSYNGQKHKKLLGQICLTVESLESVVTHFSMFLFVGCLFLLNKTNL